ncbi:hypothetical protein GV64_08280 [Endozoicomonas elysicola]|uniref:Uncharacterized protein n=1 Tax=Endozoicomonas elysicola TaxID=305900 RepID=A0A081K9B3_9GAMM|nr:hypothetical protein GV64_08280 [Endozoicomonas elysicola]
MWCKAKKAEEQVQPSSKKFAQQISQKENLCALRDLCGSKQKRLKNRFSLRAKNLPNRHHKTNTFVHFVVSVVQKKDILYESADHR